jgi:polyphosphate kinase
VPIQDSRARQRMTTIFDSLLADNTNSWSLREDGSWRRARAKKDDRTTSAQAALMRSSVARARRSLARRS